MTARVRTDIKSPAAKAVRLPLQKLTPRDLVDAARALAAAAADASELREFLDAAGLTPDCLRAALAEMGGAA